MQIRKYQMDVNKKKKRKERKNKRSVTKLKPNK